MGTKGEALDDGTVTIVSGGNQGERSSLIRGGTLNAGDYANLEALTGNRYTLEETSGLIYTFNDLGLLKL